MVCLSQYQVLRWCAFEWFYSAIDYLWFAKREFVEYLDHVGLGHVPRLTHVEWGCLKEEKEKLNQYRESVRTHYAELNAGTREGLPTDLARPLSVGQHVIAFHPRAREIHNGIVLTVNHSRCSVQFDQPELGVEYIMTVHDSGISKYKYMKDSLSRITTRSNNDVVDGDEDQLHEEPNESHHYEPDLCTERDLCELYTTIDHQIHQLQMTKSKTSPLRSGLWHRWTSRMLSLENSLSGSTIESMASLFSEEIG
ncbi:hypothetical protein ACE6H2_026595 [Prunus campanulata]